MKKYKKKQEHQFYCCHNNQTVLMLGLNHSHIVGTVYTHKAQGWSENLEELPLQQPPPQFVYKRLSVWHNFPTDARFRVKRHKVFAHSLSSLSALWLLPPRVLCDKGTIVFCDWSNTICEAQGTQPSMVTQLSWESAGAVVTSWETNTAETR